MDGWLDGQMENTWMQPTHPCPLQCCYTLDSNAVYLWDTYTEKRFFDLLLFFFFGIPMQIKTIACIVFLVFFGGVYHERTTLPMRTAEWCLTYSANRAKLTECLNAAAVCFGTGTLSLLCYLTLFVGEKCCNLSDTQTLCRGRGCIWAYKPKYRIDDTLRR